MLEIDPALPYDVPGYWKEMQTWLDQKRVLRPHITIHGGYGKNNLGNDTILDVLISRSLEHFSQAKITVICHGPERVAGRYRDIPGLKAHHFKSKGTLLGIAKSHFYIIGGGGIINRINVYSGRQRFKLLDMKGKFLFLAAHLAKLCGAKTHFYAVGATSFPDPGVKLLARQVLQKADVVSVRDSLSIQNLKAIGITRPLVQVLDPVLSMKSASKEEGQRFLDANGFKRREGRPVVFVGFRYVRDPSVDNDAKVEAVVRLVRHLLDERSCDVVFVPASQHPTEHFEDDLDLGRRVKKTIDGHEGFTLVTQYPLPKVTMAAFSLADACIFERLYACILTSLTQVPVYAVAYDNKVKQYMELIGRGHLLINSEKFVESHDLKWIDELLSRANLNENNAKIVKTYGAVVKG